MQDEMKIEFEGFVKALIVLIENDTPKEEMLELLKGVIKEKTTEG